MLAAASQKVINARRDRAMLARKPKVMQVQLHAGRADEPELMSTSKHLVSGMIQHAQSQRESRRAVEKSTRLVGYASGP